MPESVECLPHECLPPAGALAKAAGSVGAQVWVGALSEPTAAAAAVVAAAVAGLLQPVSVALGVTAAAAQALAAAPAV